jgi:RNA polymerase sigma-70 factor, ECF subfamily
VAALRDPFSFVPLLRGTEAGADEHTGVRRDHALLTRLYEDHGARIHRFLRDLLGDAALAADATQETFVRAYRQLATFRDGASVAPWLFGIARNVSLEVRRARFRAARVIAPSTDEGVAEPLALGSPESDLLSREALRVVDVALDQLSDDRRAMLLLRLDHGLAYEEIAELMGFSLAKVKVEIFRARAVLRSVMTNYEDGGMP